MRNVITALLLALCFGLSAQTWDIAELLSNPAGGSSDRYGISVATDGDFAVVGASYADVGSMNQGAVYVYAWGSGAWVLSSILLASDGAVGDQFGSSVAIDGDYIIVGATAANGVGNYSGKAYIFHWDGANWTEQANLTHSDEGGEDYFGCSVDISGDYAIVGAYGKLVGGVARGGAYVYERTGVVWTEQTMLMQPEVGSYDMYGATVAIDSDTAVVGCARADMIHSAAGAAYVYTRDGIVWSLQQVLVAIDGDSFLWFGTAVDIDGQFIIVSAPNSEGNAYNTGCAYIFENIDDVWMPAAKLVPANTQENDNFGQSVAIRGNFAVFGSEYADNESGRAVLFYNIDGVWTEYGTFYDSEVTTDEHFGESLALGDNRLFCGAPMDIIDSVQKGSASVFPLPVEPENIQPGILYISEVSDNLTGQAESTGYIEIYNRSSKPVILDGVAVVRGAESAGVFVADVPEVAHNFVSGSLLPGNSYLIVGNGADEATFKEAWGISEDIQYMASSAALNITDGYAYQIDALAVRAEMDHSINVVAGSAVIQETPGVWMGSAPESSTPGEGSSGQTLPVVLNSFTAVCATDGSALLAWTTESEADMLGFYVLRSDNDHIVDAAAVSELVDATNTPQHMEYSFSDIDVDAGATYYYWLQSVELDGSSTPYGPVSVTLTEGGEGGETPEIPLVTALSANYPNPFNPSTTIRFSIAEGQTGELAVFNLRGQRLASWNRLGSGKHSIVWDAGEAGSGVYFYRLTTGEESVTKKMLLVK